MKKTFDANMGLFTYSDINKLAKVFNSGIRSRFIVEPKASYGMNYSLRVINTQANENETIEEQRREFCAIAIHKLIEQIS